MYIHFLPGVGMQVANAYNIADNGAVQQKTFWAPASTMPLSSKGRNDAAGEVTTEVDQGLLAAAYRLWPCTPHFRGQYAGRPMPAASIATCIFFPKDLGHRLLVEQVADVPAIYTVLGNRKTSLSGAYHAFDFAKLAAFAHRFNRRFHLETFPGRLLVAALAIGARSERCLRRVKELANQA